MVSVSELQLNIHVPGGQSYSHPTLPMAVDGKKVTTKAARVHALSVKRFGIEEDMARECFFSTKLIAKPDRLFTTIRIID